MRKAQARDPLHVLGEKRRSEEELAPSLLCIATGHRKFRGRPRSPSGFVDPGEGLPEQQNDIDGASPIERQDSRCAEALPSDEDLSLDGMELNTDGSAALADQIGDLHIELDESWLTRSPPRKKHARTSFGPPGSPVEGGRGSRGSRGRPTSVVCEPSTSLEGEEGRECGGGALEGAMRCDPPAVLRRRPPPLVGRPAEPLHLPTPLGAVSEGALWPPLTAPGLCFQGFARLPR
eukprot:tig00001073_g6825.t1